MYSDLYIRDISEMIVTEQDDPLELIEDRAGLFVERSAEWPECIFLSPDVYSRIAKSMARQTYAPPSAAGIMVLQYVCTYGTLKVHVAKGHMNFVMIGLETTLENYKKLYNIPRDLSAQAMREYIDEEFEKALLDAEV